MSKVTSYIKYQPFMKIRLSRDAYYIKLGRVSSSYEKEKLSHLAIGKLVRWKWNEYIYFSISDYTHLKPQISVHGLKRTNRYKKSS